MKRFFVYAKNEDVGDTVREIAEDKGLVYDEGSPDFIITVGGDGTFLTCEREWPTIPKLLVRDSLVCFKCHDEPVEDVLEKIADGKEKVVEHVKLEADIIDEDIHAVNDVVVRNIDPRRALRFRVALDGDWSDILIGDGVVISTPFGSTGYFNSITRETFEDGIGIAYNNLTEEKEHEMLSEESIVEVEVVRGEADVAIDNYPEVLKMEPGDRLRVKKADEYAKTVTHKHHKFFG